MTPIPREALDAAAAETGRDLAARIVAALRANAVSDWHEDGDAARPLILEIYLDDLTAAVTGILGDGDATVTVSRDDVRAVVALARRSRHLAEDPATDRLAAAADPEGARP
ncbi:MAG: hypothetical protein M3Y33_08565 [Actinomycetota bacterium]|nr:hypothetical protein [Actinomycetota bacterium]